MSAGAAYVPVDPDAPAVRNAFIHADCAVSAVIIDREFVDTYREAFEALARLNSYLQEFRRDWRSWG